MFFGTNSKLAYAENSELELVHQHVDIVNKFKYLGVRFDSRLHFDAHDKYLVGEIEQELETLGRMKCYLGTKTAQLSHNSLISPLFTFNDHIYDPLTPRDAQKLQLLQNRTCLTSIL